MKFNKLLETKYRELFEQVPPQDLNIPAPEAPVAAPAPAAAVPSAEPPQQKPLTPEGEVFLINLIRKALFMNPDDLGLKTIKELPEVNAKNASEILDKIVKLMQVEAIDLDVNTK